MDCGLKGERGYGEDGVYMRRLRGYGEEGGRDNTGVIIVEVESEEEYHDINRAVVFQVTSIISISDKTYMKKKPEVSYRKILFSSAYLPISTPLFYRLLPNSPPTPQPTRPQP